MMMAPGRTREEGGPIFISIFCERQSRLAASSFHDPTDHTYWVVHLLKAEVWFCHVPFLTGITHEG